ncbi:lactonase family protein [Cohnella sp. WQ 127256]|uniref:lactonase family protein n=1 Tax=Cohnella sp. WQ 127256 TaxID=2938790 RepID=UPI0021197917|nr:lactonase family protein [Cohnella sp. WQ 127256]
MSTLQTPKSTVIIGTYVDKDSPSIYVSDFEKGTGALTIHQQLSGVKNPSFLDINLDKEIVYFINVSTDEEGRNVTGVASYQLSPDHLNLTLLNEQQSLPATSCHITLDQTKTNLIVCSYHGGMIGLIPLDNDGLVGKTKEVHQHTGSSILPIQTQSRTHSANIDPTNQFVIVADLGADRIVVYKLNADQHTLTPHNEISVAPGAGPRHSVFHPTLPYFYVINELNSTINGYQFDATLGLLTEIETLNTLPPEYSESNACADIHISPDGLYLYGSNRGHDSIVVYQIDPSNGKLTLVEHASTLGKHPRNFTLSPDGAYLLVANMDSNNIVTFVRDAISGKLQPNGQILNVAKPVCIRFVEKK